VVTDLMLQRFELEQSQNWRGWVDKMPAINFPSDWDIKLLPPFSGALVRFSASSGESTVSVYLDVFEELGFFGEPYWEIYPYEDDIYRCAMAKTGDLINAIGESFVMQDNNRKR